MGDRADTPDAQRLKELGYQPVLARRMGPFGNFAISFSVISVLTGCMTLYGYGMGHGGPAVMMWGWVGAGAMVLIIGMALAEVTSAYPTSGAMYYMARILGGPRWGYYTGWINLLGMLGGLAGSGYGAAAFLGALLSLQTGYEPTPGSTLLILAVILIAVAAINLCGVRIAAFFNDLSVWWHLVGIVTIVGTLWILPDSHQSPSFVFGEFVNDTGFSNPLYVCALGLLLTMYTFTGYDASAHLSEETTQAAVSAPRGIIKSIVWSWIGGFILLAGLTFAIQDYAATQATKTGVPPAQILIDALGTDGATLMLLLVIGAMFFCTIAVTTSGSRMVFAVSRDGELPFSHLWRRISRRTLVPYWAVCMTVVAAFALTLPSLWSTTAYGAITAISVVGITPVYIIPVFLKLVRPERFTRGPWHLGRWSNLVGWTAVVWVTFCTVLFCLPQSYPVTIDTMNYAVVTLAGALLLATAYWPFARRVQETRTHSNSPRDIQQMEDIV
ncbi:amino acid permease [Streptomyces sp. NPDC087420]|uniref:amino acid permease n=1 Tax=Streptomyces sp. NPDC087420 TaxID=3365785 RepID=UPI003834C6B9